MDLPTQSAARTSTAGASRILSAPFVVAMLMLVTAAILAGPVAKWLKIKQGKRPLPLKRPLNTLDERAIAPYRVVHRQVLEPALVEALGTDRYLSWVLADTSVSRDDPLREVHLLVTYDSGGHNLVPHTPDVCYLGTGYAAAQPHENMRINLPSLGGGPTKIPIRVCTFTKSALFGRKKTSVVYTFHCNGRFVATRTGVRILINDLRNTYAYFSKVEASFPNATREQSIEGAAKLFDRILPVLVRNHWPDFDAEEQAARRQPGGAD